jgi:hypothetical protein
MKGVEWPQNPDNLTVFAVIRDPIARFVSGYRYLLGYRYVRKKEKEVGHQILGTTAYDMFESFREFVPKLIASSNGTTGSVFSRPIWPRSSGSMNSGCRGVPFPPRLAPSSAWTSPH